MTVREMHIDLDQSTQLVAANRSRKWYPEEKDWVLNKIQERFIRSKLRPKKDQSGNITGGFELDQAGIDDIRTLLVNNFVLRPYIVDDERYKCFLPSNYAYLIGDGSRTSLLCGGTPVKDNDTLFITTLRQTRSAKGSSPFYETLAVQLPDLLLTIPGDLPYGNAYAGYSEVEDISFLVPWLIWKSGWYWEKFGNLYKPSNYIQVQKTAPVTTPSVTADGTPSTDYATSTMALEYHTGTGKLVNNRLCSTDTIRNLRQAAFFGTAHYSPITELEDNLLWIYRDSSYTVSNAEISYVRKPQPISLSLASDCELPEGVHRLICDLAAEYLQNRTKDTQGVQLSEADIVKRLIL